MTLTEFEKRFEELGSNYKTKDVDTFNKKLIKEKVDVSFLKDIILSKPQYHRSYFQVSLGYRKSIEDKLLFIEENFDKLNDWWHVDQLLQFTSKKLTFDLAYQKASVYKKHNNPFVRRWGYVMFINHLAKTNEQLEKLFALFEDDEEYYVIMGEAWALSCLGVYYPEETLNYLKLKPLKYDIVGKAVQKICDSFRIDEEYKNKFKEIRKYYK